jgi:hypothetical protein
MRWAYNWLAAYRSGGLGALKLKILNLVADQTPSQHRCELALWTIDVVRWLICERFQLKLGRPSTHRLMHQLGLSSQRPLHRAYEQEAAARSPSSPSGSPRVWRTQRLPQRHDLGAWSLSTDFRQAPGSRSTWWWTAIPYTDPARSRPSRLRLMGGCNTTFRRQTRRQ